MIFVGRPYLPNREKFLHYVDRIYSSCQLTNHGPLVQELTTRLEEYLGVNNLLLVSNGTMALQIAYRVLGLDLAEEDGCNPEVITTPFSFVATSSSLKWQKIQPVFCDIEQHGWCLDPELAELAITPRTRGMVPVHVFGRGCEVDALEEVASRNHIKVIYDGAHAFGIHYRDRSILQKGDATTLSFHATKLFHTIEGGAIVFREREDLEKAQSMISFGICGNDKILSLGINAKMNEFQAAMGLCVLEDIDKIIEARKEICESYRESLRGLATFQTLNPDCDQNYSYFPLLLDDESTLLRVRKNLENRGYSARRYFYPSLDTLSFFGPSEEKSVSRNVSSRVLCLPVYLGLDGAEVKNICNTITSVVSRETHSIR